MVDILILFIYLVIIESDLKPLELEEKLCVSAQAWADKNGNEENMYHSTGIEYKNRYDKKFGENLAYWGTSIPGAPEITNLLKFK